MSQTFTDVLLVGGIETVFRTPETPNLMTDVYDVGELTYTPNIARLTRNTQRKSYSPVASRAGQQQAQISFPMEINGSGTVDASKEPAYARLLRACGMAQTKLAAAGLALAVPDMNNKHASCVLASGTGMAYVGTSPRLVMIEATAAAQVKVTSHETGNGDVAYSQVGVAVTTGTAFAGPQGSMLKLTFASPLIVGDKWFALVAPPGHMYTPVSDQDTMNSMYFYFYAGNKRHLLTGCRGTVAMNATAGEFGTLTFTFTGDFTLPTAVAMPALGTFSYGSYPTPPMVELADLSMDGVLIACPTAFGWDLSNTVNARLCANAKGATAGASLSGRAPVATFDMDSVPLAQMDVFTPMLSGDQIMLSGYVGYTPGNSFMFLANGQITGVSYANASGGRKNNNTLGLVGRNGDDELVLFIT